MPAHPNGPGTGFIGLNQYLDANTSALGTEGRTLADAAGAKAKASQTASDAVSQDAQTQGAATGNFDNTKANGYGAALDQQRSASDALHAFSSPGGIANALKDQYGTAPSTGFGFDSALLGGSSDAQNSFGAVQKQYGGLDSYLQDHSKAGAAAGNALYKPPAPPAAPAPGTFTPPPQNTAWKQSKVGQKTGQPDNGDWDPTGGVGNGTFGHPAAPTSSTPTNPFGRGGTSDDPAPTQRKQTPQGSSFTRPRDTGWGGT